jgi:hypothetical protein
MLGSRIGTVLGGCRLMLAQRFLAGGPIDRSRRRDKVPRNRDREQGGIHDGAKRNISYEDISTPAVPPHEHDIAYDTTVGLIPPSFPKRADEGHAARWQSAESNKTKNTDRAHEVPLRDRRRDRDPTCARLHAVQCNGLQSACLEKRALEWQRPRAPAPMRFRFVRRAVDRG